ncbi:MAG TPA: DNA polymerase III subunit gamma/tau [Bacteroidota bacterium]|nr:DNA polymerase III subunit gamma/tau [Bacteroidota bacterium]
MKTADESKNYIVTARKWRPQVTGDVVGQEHVTTTLRNAIATNRLSHAYLFSGPRGVGKTTTARILAKAINCLHPRDNEPDNSCELCAELAEGRSLNVFEIDGASNRGVDEIRNLRDSVRYPPAKGKYKVYIIDEVHMLTKEAFNALLKTLEEPPPFVVFIFATTEIHKVPATILSRCQRFDFRRISVREITDRLRFIAGREKIRIDDEALLIVAKRADGSMRDAQSIFDQLVSFCGASISSDKIISMLSIVDDEIYFRVTDILRKRDPAAALLLIDEIVNRGVDAREFLLGLIEHLRNLLITVTMKSTDLLETADHYRVRYKDTADAFSDSDLLRLIRIVSAAELELRRSQHPRFKLELCLLQMIALDRTVQIETLIEEIERLRNSRPAGSPSASGARPAASAAPQNASAPVRGSVKATQPVLHPDQIVPPPVQYTGTHDAPAHSFTPETAGTPIPSDILQQKWPILVAEACKRRIAVGSILSESRPVDISGNQIRIACPDGFHLDSFKRNKQFILDLAESIYGAKVRIEGILGTFPSAPSPEPSAPSAAPANPVIRAIMDEFGAKEIN